MIDLGLRAKLHPDQDRLGSSRRYVVRAASFLVAKLLAPAMLVRFTDLRALGVVMILAEIEPANTLHALVDQRDR